MTVFPLLRQAARHVTLALNRYLSPPTFSGSDQALRKIMVGLKVPLTARPLKVSRRQQ